MKAGDLVYCVIEIDVPNEGPSTWKVASVLVASASDKQIRLKTYFPGRYRKQFDPNALGRVFFETPLSAIQGFLAALRCEIDALARRHVEAERAIVWATSQEGMKP